MQNFETRLSGGHPNSLGNTVEVVEEVLYQPSLFQELFDCYQSKDEVVRLRVSNAMKRICKENKEILIPYIDALIGDIAKINQASTQWTLAQLFLSLEKDMSSKQMTQAKKIVKNNLAKHNDWIVLNASMDTLGKWSKKDAKLKHWLEPHLQRLQNDSRKSVANRAQKLLKQL
ncbi:MAG: hypothetical protein AAF518_12740 [Spirochaetota bacterium]